MSMTETCNSLLPIEGIIAGTALIPGVRIDRAQYLTSALNMWVSDVQAEQAVNTTPAKAGISRELIDRLAEDAIAYENTLATITSVTTGLPSNPAIAVPATAADLSQFYAHVIRIAQKLGYLYGWKDVFELEDGNMDDATRNAILLFLGVMSGVDAAERALMNIARSAAAVTEKRLAAKALTKGAVYPIVKRVAYLLGIRMNKQNFSRAMGKAVPLAGGLLSGILTLASFSGMAHRLKDYLATTPLANPSLVDAIPLEDYDVS